MQDMAKTSTARRRNSHDAIMLEFQTFACNLQKGFFRIRSAFPRCLVTFLMPNRSGFSQKTAWSGNAAESGQLPRIDPNAPYHAKAFFIPGRHMCDVGDWELSRHTPHASQSSTHPPPYPTFFAFTFHPAPPQWIIHRYP